jgi:hypothetical protein
MALHEMNLAIDVKGGGASHCLALYGPYNNKFPIVDGADMGYQYIKDHVSLEASEQMEDDAERVYTRIFRE